MADSSSQATGSDADIRGLDGAASFAVRDFRAFLKSIPAPVLVLDHDSRIRDINPVAERVLAATECGESLFSLVHPDDLAELRKFLDHASPDTTLETRFRNAGGEWESFKATASRTQPGAGAGELIVLLSTAYPQGRGWDQVVGDDIHFSAVADSLNEGLVITDLDEVVLYVNPRMSELTGYSAEELVGRVASEVLLPQDERERMREEYARRSQGIAGAYTVRHVRRDGTEYWIEVHASPLRNSRGEIVGTVGAATDVTERQRARQREIQLASARAEVAERRRAQQALETMRTALEASVDGIGIIAMEGEFTYVNQALAELFGYPTADHVVGRQWGIVIAQSERTRLYDEAAVARRSHGYWHGETEGLRRDGSTVPIDVAITKVEGVGFVCLIRDVTERRQWESALQAAKEDAERSNRAKSEFLSRMSHELRTPLNAILGFAQLLALDVRPGEPAENVQQILTAGQHLLGLVDEVLDIASIEAGRISVAVQPVAISGLLRECLDMVRILAAERGIQLDSADALKSTAQVNADEQKLKQVLLNLLTNAIKYNRRGGLVTVSCDIIGSDRLRVCVSDTGPGIPTDKMERLFTPFDRLDADPAGLEGTGLDLALSRGLVEVMDGRLDVQSELGRGSRFAVELPLAASGENGGSVPAAEKAGETDERPLEHDHTVLFIEDNPANVRLMERVFRHRPRLRLVTAIDGTSGLQAARSERPDLVLLDLNLPDLTGDKVLLELREDPDLHHVPVIMISGDATPRQVQRLLDLGARGYITKPFDIHELLASVDEALRG